MIAELRGTPISTVAAECIRYGMERIEVTGAEGLRALAKKRYQRDMELADSFENWIKTNKEE